MKNIGIIGCGWLGSRLAKHLGEAHSIYTTTTTKSKRDKLTAAGYHATCAVFSDDISAPKTAPWAVGNTLDSVIITVPFSKRGDPQALQRRFAHICQFIAGFDKPIFLMSSIGIYPLIRRHISENNVEDSALNPTLLAVEQQVRNHFPQTHILRLGGLMGDNRRLSNYNVSALDDVVNHVHYTDICLIIEEMLKRNMDATILNIVAPEHPTKREIIHHQTGKASPTNCDQSSDTGDRIISSQLSEQMLDYQYRHPNPKFF